MSADDEELAGELRARLRRPVVVIGVGSNIRGDDAFGIETVRVLRSAGGLEGVEVFEGDVAPENLAERVVRASPRTVVAVDAAEFAGEVGELRIIEPAELAWGLIGTHAPSLELLAEYLARRCGATTLLLAARPGATAMGEVVSPTMEKAVGRAAAIIRCALAGCGSPQESIPVGRDAQGGRPPSPPDDTGRTP